MIALIASSHWLRDANSPRLFLRPGDNVQNNIQLANHLYPLIEVPWCAEAIELEYVRPLSLSAAFSLPTMLPTASAHNFPCMIVIIVQFYFI